MGKQAPEESILRDFGYKGEAWRVAAHGIAARRFSSSTPGGTGRETSIGRMTEPNDTSAPLQDIIVMLCDQLIEDRGMMVSNPGEPFAWRQIAPLGARGCSQCLRARDLTTFAWWRRYTIF